MFDISITRSIEYTTPFSFETLLTTPTARLAVDSALATLIFNFLSFLVASPGKIKVEFRSKQMIKQVLLKLDKHSKIDIHININYKYELLMRLVRWLGDIKIRISGTQWTSIDIDRKEEYGEMINYDNPSKEILISCQNILDGNKSGKVDLLLYVMSNTSVHREGSIQAALVVDADNVLKRILLKLIIGLAIEGELSNIEVVNIDIEGE